MIQIRKNVFETNSSSTHSIAIPKELKLPKNSYEAWDWDTWIQLDEFGWDFGSADPVDYLYTALCYLDDQEKLEYFKKFLLQHRSGLNDYDLDFAKPHYNEHKDEETEETWRSLDYGYIDHVDELLDLIDKLFSDDDLLLRYINGAHIMTGNDNATEDERDILKNFDRKYKKKGYDIYHKGN